VSGGIAIARILGIEIRVSYAWAFLLALVTLVGSEQAAATSPALGTVFHWAIGLVVALAFLATVIAHELAHATVGRRRGVPATSIQLGFIGGLAPLSIEAPRPRDELAIAVAGPVLSLAIAALAIPAAMAVGFLGGGLTAIAGGILVVGGLNLVLAVLSLLPGLPLDGGRVVRALAWARTHDRDRASAVAARVGRLLGFALVGVGVALALGNLISAGLLVLCLGWLLTTGASTMSKRLGVERLLRGTTVGDATRREVPRVGPNLTIDTFADRYQGEDGISCLPVMEDETVLGVVGAKRLQRLGRRKFAATRAADVMATPPAARFLAPGEDLWAAVEMMNRLGYDGLAVVEEGALVGMVTRESIGDLLRARTGDPDPSPARGGRA